MKKILVVFNLLISFCALSQDYHLRNTDLRLGGRFFIVSFLEDIFGKDNISASPNGHYRKSGHLYPLTVEFFIKKRDLAGAHVISTICQKMTPALWNFHCVTVTLIQVVLIAQWSLDLQWFVMDLGLGPAKKL